MRVRKSMVAAIAACLVLVLGGTVLASTIYETFISRMGEDYRDQVYAVNQTDTQAGIRMDVAAAVNDGYQSVVYLSMQDTTEAQRIDATTELYNVNIDSAWYSHGEQVHFDEASQTATFRLSGGSLESLQGQEVTVSVSTILSGASYVDEYDTGLSLAEVAAAYPEPLAEEAVPLDMEGAYSYMYGSDEEANDRFLADFDSGAIQLLPTGQNPQPLADDLPWLSLSNAGMLGGRFHLQLAPDEDLGRYNLFSPHLWWEGQREDIWYGHGEVPREPYAEMGHYTYYRYQEYIYDLPPGVPLEDIYIMGWYREYAIQVEGNWSVSFTVEEDVKPLTAQPELQIGSSMLLHRVEVTSIGVAIHITGQMQPEDFLHVSVILKDGTIVQTVSSAAIVSMPEDGDGNPLPETSLHYDAFSRPIDLEEVDRVEINGQPFRLR